MTVHAHTAAPRRIHRLLGGVVLAGLLAVLAPATSHAAVSTFGSSLSVPATMNTAENLGYPGTYTPVPPNPEAPNGLFHTFHYGADTALWNQSQLTGEPRVATTGQALKVSLEGCAQRAPGGPAPLTQIHFQDVSPLSDGGVKVNISSQGFDIPVCGEGGASGSTITTYEPVNLCVSAGDYVAFNDEGGYVENVYRAGVPYQVLGSVGGSVMDSFLRGGGTGNGATLSPSFTGANEGFATNRGEELMMRVTLGTGSDATHICAGGTQGLPPALAPIRVSPQTDGVNQSRIVSVAVFCRVSPVCRGVATLSMKGRGNYGRSGFTIQSGHTTHLPIRVTSQLMSMIRRSHGVSTTISAVVSGQTIAQTIVVKIF